MINKMLPPKCTLTLYFFLACFQRKVSHLCTHTAFTSVSIWNTSSIIPFYLRIYREHIFDENREESKGRARCLFFPFSSRSKTNVECYTRTHIEAQRGSVQCVLCVCTRSMLCENHYTPGHKELPTHNRQQIERNSHATNPFIYIPNTVPQPFPCSTFFTSLSIYDNGALWINANVSYTCRQDLQANLSTSFNDGEVSVKKEAVYTLLSPFLFFVFSESPPSHTCLKVNPSLSLLLHSLLSMHCIHKHAICVQVCRSLQQARIVSLEKVPTVCALCTFDMNESKVDRCVYMRYMLTARITIHLATHTQSIVM